MTISLTSYNKRNIVVFLSEIMQELSNNELYLIQEVENLLGILLFVYKKCK